MNIKKVKKLRKETGFSILKCKKALEFTSNDLNKALEKMNSEKNKKITKMTNRDTLEGLVFSYIHSDKLGSLIKLKCETDFVSKNKNFRELAKNLAMQVVASESKNIDDFLKEKYIKDVALTVEDLINKYIVELGENIQLEKFSKFEI